MYALNNISACIEPVSSLITHLQYYIMTLIILRFVVIVFTHHTREYRPNTSLIVIVPCLFFWVEIKFLRCNAMQCNAMQCNAMQCNAMQCNLLGVGYWDVQWSVPLLFCHVHILVDISSDRNDAVPNSEFLNYCSNLLLLSEKSLDTTLANQCHFRCSCCSCSSSCSLPPALAPDHYHLAVHQQSQPLAYQWLEVNAHQ